MICPQCGARNPDDARVCAQCAVDFLDVRQTRRELAPGDVLAHRYRIEKRLGRGGMGIVYLATDTSLDIPVAIKVLDPTLARDTRAVLELKEEARIAMGLTHLNVMKVHQFEDQPDIKFLIMEYIDGPTLEELLLQSPGRKLPADAVVGYARQICEGLHYAHGRKVWHRDIKPANLMVDPEGNVKITDFGTARVAKDSLTRVTGQDSAGTLLYMSPEQTRGKGADWRSDLYSLGVTLYELLSGRPPFHTGNIGHQILNETPEPLEGIPPRVNEIILKTLAKDKEQRWQSARELQAALAGKIEAEADRRPQAAEVKPQPKEPRKMQAWLVRHPRQASTLALAILLGVLLAVWLVYSSQRDGGKSNVSVGESAKSGNSLDDTAKSPSTRSDAGPADPTSPTTTRSPSAHRAPARDAGPADPTSPTTTAPSTGVTSSSAIGGAKFEFVRIPAGEFLMVSENGDADERPTHRVRISRDFEMGKYEVTQAQWMAVMGDNPSHFKGSDLPVETVSWDATQTFIKQLNERDSKYQYRLPTEAEWEYAARAGSTGDYAGNLDAMAWYYTNSGNKTHPVGQKQPNAWGLYDMHGNVWEWCQDWYDSRYYSQSQAVDPQGPSAGSLRVPRGGGWNCGAVRCRSAFRSSNSPGARRAALGFRLVRTAR